VIFFYRLGSDGWSEGDGPSEGRELISSEEEEQKRRGKKNRKEREGQDCKRTVNEG
jgi:hypothetical protein